MLGKVTALSLNSNFPSTSQLREIRCSLARNSRFDRHRVFDLVMASLLLLISLPILIVVALLILTTAGRPVLFFQGRLTRDKRIFRLVKFRTMRNNAEETTGAVFTSQQDKRVLWFGHFLRRYHLDELPQLLNVLAGHMSIVGPRPERPEIADKLRTELTGFDKRTQVNAGITGLAQIHRGYIGNYHHYRHKLALDRLYIQKRSVSYDAALLLRTSITVVFPNGR